MKKDNNKNYRLTVPKGIVIMQTKNKGRGVFAIKNFQKNEIIEISPVIPLNKYDSSLCEKTKLDNYIFCWKDENDGAVILGYGSIYNHSYTPNSLYIHNYKNNESIFRALKCIKKGEEITVNYNCDPADQSSINWIKRIY